MGINTNLSYTLSGLLRRGGLSSEPVESPSLPLEGVDHVHGGDRLSLAVRGVGDGIADHALEESLEDLAGVVVDVVGDPLDSATPREPPDGRFGDPFEHGSLGFAMSPGDGFVALALS